MEPSTKPPRANTSKSVNDDVVNNISYRPAGSSRGFYRGRGRGRGYHSANSSTTRKQVASTSKREFINDLDDFPSIGGSNVELKTSPCSLEVSNNEADPQSDSPSRPSSTSSGNVWSKSFASIVKENTQKGETSQLTSQFPSLKPDQGNASDISANKSSLSVAKGKHERDSSLQKKDQNPVSSLSKDDSGECDIVEEKLKNGLTSPSDSLSTTAPSSSSEISSQSTPSHESRNVKEVSTSRPRTRSSYDSGYAPSSSLGAKKADRLAMDQNQYTPSFATPSWDNFSQAAPFPGNNYHMQYDMTYTYGPKHQMQNQTAAYDYNMCNNTEYNEFDKHRYHTDPGVNSGLRNGIDQYSADEQSRNVSPRSNYHVILRHFWFKQSLIGLLIGTNRRNLNSILNGMRVNVLVLDQITTFYNMVFTVIELEGYPDEIDIVMDRIGRQFPNEPLYVVDPNDAPLSMGVQRLEAFTPANPENYNAITVNYIQDPGEFYISLLGPFYERLNDILHQLNQKYWPMLEENPIPYTFLSPELIYICLGDDKTVFRGRILNLPHSDDDTVIVENVDSGVSGPIACNRLRNLNVNLKSIPLQAIRCSLANVRTDDPEGKWSPEAIEFFKNAINNAEKIFCRLVNAPKSGEESQVLLFVDPKGENKRSNRTILRMINKEIRFGGFPNVVYKPAESIPVATSPLVPSVPIGGDVSSNPNYFDGQYSPDVSGIYNSNTPNLQYPGYAYRPRPTFVKPRSKSFLETTPDGPNNVEGKSETDEPVAPTKCNNNVIEKNSDKGGARKEKEFLVSGESDVIVGQKAFNSENDVLEVGVSAAEP